MLSFHLQLNMEKLESEPDTLLVRFRVRALKYIKERTN